MNHDKKIECLQDFNGFISKIKDIIDTLDKERYVHCDIDSSEFVKNGKFSLDGLGKEDLIKINL